MRAADTVPIRTSSVHAPLPKGHDQAATLKHTEVLHSCRQRGIQTASELADRLRAGSELLDDAPPGGLGECAQDVVH
jgi:hypothetical protein